jgi:hypothetical protein
VADLAPASRTGWRPQLRTFAELLALCGFAITLPLLELFGRGVEQFALRGASPMQIVVFALAVTLVPATGLWLSEVVVGLVSQRAQRAIHLVYIVGLVAAFTIQVARPLTTGPALLVLSLGVGVVAALAYRRLPVVRLWLGFAAFAPFGFLFLFLVTSPTASLISDDSAAAEVEVGNPAPVVMLVLDELPLESLLRADGEVDATLYPNLARLAGDSHWFRNTTTATSTTWHAVPSILSGQLPDGRAVPPSSAHHPDNAFTLLGDSYDMRVTETLSRLCPTSVCTPTTPSSSVWRGLTGDAVRVMRSRLSITRPADDPVTGFAELAPEAEGDVPGAPDRSVSQPDRFRTLIDGLEGGSTFSFLHILLPHVPYRYLPSGAVYEVPDPELGHAEAPDEWGDEEWPVALAHQRHLLQAAYVDQLVGILLDELEAKGIYDEAMVVVTADHGVSFRAGGPIRALEGQSLDDVTTPDLLWVPFFLKEPGQSDGTVSDANVQLIDVLPTMADVLDVDIPFPVDGQSALGPPRTTTDRPYYVSDVTPYGVKLGPQVTVDGAAGFAAVMERTAEAFLGSGGPERLWRVGPAPELVGQRVDDLPAGRLGASDAVLATPEAFADVGPGGFTPALIRGHLDDAAPGTVLAVAVNGVVVATGPTYREDGGLAFAVVVDDAVFTDGANDVQVYEVR